MASMARRYIYAGFLLLISALALSLAALYQQSWLYEAEKKVTLDGDGRVYIAASLVSGRVAAEDVVWVSAVFGTDCPHGVQIAINDPVKGLDLAETILPGQTVSANMSPTAAIQVEPLGGGMCHLVAELRVAGRSYPLRWASLPSLALMIAGTASLSLGAVLKLAGLEEEP